MITFSLANSLSASVRIYRAMLVVYPKKFRENYETQMVQVFRDSIREAYHENRMFGLIDVWLHTFADLLVTALIERISERSRYMFHPKVVLWCGLASAFGGVLWLMLGLSPSGAGIVLALVLGLGGLAGLYSRQAGQGGRLGLAGFALGILGTVLALATLEWGFASGRLSYIRTERDALLAAAPMLIISLAIAVLGIGLVLLGIVNLRAKIQHHWRGIPLGLGILNITQSFSMWLAYYVPMSQGRDPWYQWNFAVNVLSPASFALLGICWMGLGIMLAIEANAQTAPSEASAETHQ